MNDDIDGLLARWEYILELVPDDSLAKRMILGSLMAKHDNADPQQDWLV